MSTTVSFRLTGTTPAAITVEVPYDTQRKPYLPRQVVGRAVGGGWDITEEGDDLQRYILSFQDYPAADLDQIYDFIRTTCGWRQSAFDYKDETDTWRTGFRYVSGFEPEALTGIGGTDGTSTVFWSGQLVFEEDPNA